jgi:hypothetical protein
LLPRRLTERCLYSKGQRGKKVGVFFSPCVCVCLGKERNAQMMMMMITRGGKREMSAAAAAALLDKGGE